MKPENAVRFDRTLGPVFYKLHRWMYEASDGRIGASSPQGPMLLLSTVGRRTGQPRTTPLLFMRDGECFIVVASNGGRPQPPAWYLNLQAEPKASVRDGRHKLDVVAETPASDERDELWRRLHEFYAGWAHYQTLTDRELPVIRLRPLAASADEAGPGT
ncbi:MAG TPA: nitroreductase family deazaflavin-dependent oxidoreductase [Acidimicrobiales bacterium]|nr:nitroreductase family deazaflavin-dependent oxidoreductase [Acidimicrobiales bacterium]